MKVRMRDDLAQDGLAIPAFDDEEESPNTCPNCGNTDKEQTVYLTEEIT